MNALQKLWAFLSEIAVRDAKRQTYVVLPDPKRTTPKILPDQHYFRLRVTDMFLRRDREWFTEFHPAVTAQVRLRFANEDHTPVCRVAAPPKDKVGPGVYQNYPLTDLLPFSGGEVEFQADLLGMKGDNAFSLAFKLLEGFSGLVGAPLTPALNVAEQLANGLNKLLEHQPAMRIGFHQAFAANGGKEFEPAYHIVVLADDGTFRGTFSVVNDRLCYAEKASDPAKPLDGYDYVVFRIEAAETRDDWRFPEIDAQIRNAKKALLTPDPEDTEEKATEKYKRYRSAAILAVHASPDLVVADRRRIVEALKAELKEVEKQKADGAAPGKTRTLAEIIAARARKPAVAAADGELTLAEALSD